MNVPRFMLQFTTAHLLLLVMGFGQVQSSREDRILKLESELAEAKSHMTRLQRVIETLSEAMDALKAQEPQAAVPTSRNMHIEKNSRMDKDSPVDNYSSRILIPDLGKDERGKQMSGKPELFVQSRYHTLPLHGATNEDIRPNFALTRMETRWSGRLSERIGLGFELQYHPAPQGSAFEIINDAFVEYYPDDAITIRAGQFVKPFGFDTQQSSSVRETPERGIFAGYFFPGQRDRGVMLIAGLENMSDWLKGTTFYAALLNGNRFFDDNNRNLNYNFRIRKLLGSLPLAIGASAQLGRQILPPGMSGNTRENIYGTDLQFAWKRLGLRGEFVMGNMPSTLLDVAPDFAPAFRPPLRSTGAVAFANVQWTARDDVYGRYDQFTNDPVTGRTVKAFNFGYVRTFGEHAKVGIDYQFKNRLSHNDDRLNTRLQVTWNVLY